MAARRLPRDLSARSGVLGTSRAVPLGAESWEHRENTFRLSRQAIIALMTRQISGQNQRCGSRANIGLFRSHSSRIAALITLLM